jgi:ribosome biogenesis GTPase
MEVCSIILFLKLWKVLLFPLFLLRKIIIGIGKMSKEHDYQKAMQKHHRKQELRKARKKARPNAAPDKPRQKDWSQFQDDEWDMEGFYEEERVMPRGAVERRKAVRQIVNSFPVVNGANLEKEPTTDQDADFLQGTVIEVTAGQCKVAVNGRNHDCFIRGALMTQERGYSNVLAVGDFVEISLGSDDRGVVESVLPRRSLLARTAASFVGKASGQRQIVAANVDRVMIVSSWRKPQFWPELIDRYLIAAERNDLEAVICVNKIDLIEDQAEFDAALKPYRDLGYVVLLTSAEEKIGIQTLTEFLTGEIAVLAGMSGVGKSSLLSEVQPGLNLKALEVGERGKNKNQGRHTTRMATYYPLSGGGAVIDTPGIRDFGLSGLRRDEIKLYYPEFEDLAPECSFSDCNHWQELDCAVRAAVQSGGVSQLRYKNYVQIIESMQD